MYHDVVNTSPDRDPLRISVSTELFERHICYLREKGYRFLSVEEAAMQLSSSEVPDRAVVVTFDDGYESLLRVAAPVLKRYEVPVTLFVAVDFIAKADFPWSLVRSGFTRPLNWGELTALMNTTKIEIGSHTVTHRLLHTLPPAEQEIEIDNSRQVLEELLGRPVRVFAYPFGGWGTFPLSLQSLLKRHGYAAACTNVMGINNHRTSPMALHRVRISWCDTLWRFRLKLAGAYDWSDSLRRVMAPSVPWPRQVAHW
jgi:peptidoglycan/xylan/chitin deacetylase (PgdA/CDA1 family)